LDTLEDVTMVDFDVTFAGHMYGLRHALPLLIRQGGGVIVYTTSSEIWMGETGLVLTLKRYS
jgi:NAD(P)-dependent dehydrogenase (short-subunit alcohol dehydrogenase family)